MIRRWLLRGGILVSLMVLGGAQTLFLASNLTTAEAKESVKKLLNKAFPHSQKCKRCHLRVFEEWEASAQSRSIQTAPFRVSLDRFLATAPKNHQAMCFRCHAPHILEYPEQTSFFIKEVQSRDPQIDGVGCAQCHLIKEVDETVHPPLPTFALGNTVFGSYKNAVDNLAHKSQALELYRTSNYCVSCHEILPAIGQNTSLPDLLGAWKKTSAQKEGKRCQTCHMPEAFGESANGERNRKIANHSFPGRFGKVRAKAAKLDVKTTVNGDQSTVQITIQSLVPHNLPLPHPGWSRIVLDLTILGKNLRKVYGEQRTYERVFADAKGRPTVFDFEAVKVLKDTVLKPEETRVETFTFPTPKDAPSMDVIVTLTYGAIHGPEEFVKAVEAQATLGRKDRAFRPVEIVKFKENIPLR